MQRTLSGVLRTLESSDAWTMASVPGDTILVCGWCGRVHADGEWLDPQEAFGELGLHSVGLARLSHGVCDTCAGDLKSLVRA